MARHADPDRSSFYRSLGFAALKAAGALAVVIALTVVATMLVDGRDADEVVRLEPGASPTASGTPTPSPTSAATPSPTPTPTPTPEETTPPLVEPGATPTGADPDGVTVQVLDGGVGEEVTLTVVAALEEVGYEVVAVSTARCCYEQTTVFYSEGREEVAQALSASDERFGVVEPNPNLTEDVDIHVVVGSDWPSV